MSRQWKAIGATVLAATAVTAACALWGTSVSTPAHDPDTVVVEGDAPGGPAIYLTLQPPAEGAYRAQAQVHRWVAADVYLYEATLSYVDGSGLTAFDPPLKVVVPNKVNPKSKVAFTNLRQGRRYEVAVTARGNIGGTADSMLLSAFPATASFDFRGEQDVEALLNASLKVTLAPVAFNGTATTTLTAPSDGPYQNPTATESGSAQ